MRRRLLSLLKLDGPATASLLAQRTSQAVGNISHHLHVLAAADLIEEVPELARDRRERWWRRTAGVLRWSSTDIADDAASDVVFRAETPRPAIATCHRDLPSQPASTTSKDMLDGCR